MTSLEEMMEQHAIPVDLDAIRAAIKRKRDIDREVLDLEARLSDLNAQRVHIEETQLPEMFLNAGITSIEIPASGNSPAYVAKIQDYYKANISASWDEERRVLAFETLTKLDLGPLIKSEVKVQFDRDKIKEAMDLAKSLISRGLNVSLTQTVPWKSLSSAFRELCQTGRRPSANDCDAIGARSGKHVVVKEKSE